MSTKTPIVIAAMNRKGGIGKTTLVRALASAIVHAGKSVLLIDTDPNRALISWQLRAQENGFGSSLMACKETLDMAALNTILDEAFTAGEADFIIIDTQGGGGVWADTIAAQVHIIVAPVILARTDVEDSLKSLDWYQRLAERVDQPELLPKYCSVITRFDSKTRGGESKLRQSEQQHLLTVAQKLTPLSYALRQRPAYQDMDETGLLGEIARQMRADANVLKRGQALRFEEALQEATYVLNELLAEGSGISFDQEAQNV